MSSRGKSTIRRVSFTSNVTVWRHLLILFMMAGIVVGCDSGLSGMEATKTDPGAVARTQGQHESERNAQATQGEEIIQVRRMDSTAPQASTPYQCAVRMQMRGVVLNERVVYHTERLALDVPPQVVEDVGPDVARVQYRLLESGGTLVREAICQIPARQDIAAALKQQLSWQATPRSGVRVVEVSSEVARSSAESSSTRENADASSCGDGVDICWIEQIVEGEAETAMYDPASCDNPGDGGGGSGGGSGGGGTGDWPPDDGDDPDDDWPFPPEDDWPMPPPEDDPPPPDDGGGDCTFQLDPDCPDNGDDPDDPVIAVAAPLFGVVLQDCCIDCPGDTPSTAPPSPSELDAMPTPPLPSTRPSSLDPGPWQAIQQQWNSLTDTEKKLCAIAWAYCGIAALESQFAIDFADDLYPVPDYLRRNGPNDALKHARWAAGMTRGMNVINASNGTVWAWAFLHAHEVRPNNPDAEYQMDMHNNAVGVGIAVESPLSIEDEIEGAWQNGELQEWACPDHPTDRRMGCIPDF